LLVDLSEVEGLIRCVRDESLEVDRSGERIREGEFSLSDSSIGDIFWERESRRSDEELVDRWDLSVDRDST